ncbi:MAG: zinc-ribbon domain-containing protein [Desulfobacterales bacterium]|nr:zinc-ribbon domain-containing protein [Desulfobacterales bacterium]
MIITCQECDSRFVLDDKLIKPTGTKVRCSSCKHVFKAFPKDQVEEESASAPPPSSPTSAQEAPSGSLEKGDELADELDRELDRLFGPDDDPFGGDALPEAAAEASAPEVPAAPTKKVSPTPDPSSETIEELSLDDLSFDDLEFSSEAAPVSDDLDLSELDLDLSFDDEPAAATEPSDAAETSLDFSDLESSLEDPSEAATAKVEEELDLSALSDLSSTLDAMPDQDAGPIEEPADLDLTLSGDDEVEMVGAEDSPEMDDDLDFSALDSSLSEDASSETSDDAIDFGDFELSLDEEPLAAPEEALAGDLEFSLDEGGVEEISLNGTGELELSLDLDEEPETQAASGTGAPFASEEELMMDLDLVLGDEEEPMQEAAKSAEEKLDLSELESLLAEESSGGEEFFSDGDEDIELELDFDYETQSSTEEVASETEGLGSDDFSDIEAMLEQDQATLDVGEDVDEDVSLDLELDLATSLDAPEPAPAPAPQAVSSVSATSPPSAMETVEFNDMQPPQEVEEESEPIVRKAPKRRGGNGVKIALALIFVLFFLFAILLTVYMFKDEIREKTGVAIPSIAVVEKARESLGNMGIPYVSELVKPEVKDPAGSLLLSTLDITNRFVNSASDGELFVITGKVKSGYSEMRNSLRLTGRIFIANGQEVQVKEVYAGNILSEEELKTLTMAEVDQRLKTTLGTENINARVRPGQEIPFMVVFAKLPDDLNQFTVEVTGSLPGAAIK